MIRIALCSGVLVGLLHATAFAACSPEDAMNKASEISDVLSEKLATKPDEASKIMSDMGVATGDGKVTAETCTKLDALMVRAKKL